MLWRTDEIYVVAYGWNLCCGARMKFMLWRTDEIYVVAYGWNLKTLNQQQLVETWNYQIHFHYSTIATNNEFVHSFTLNCNLIQSYGPIFMDSYIFVKSLYVQRKITLLIHKVYFIILGSSFNIFKVFKCYLSVVIVFSGNRKGWFVLKMCYSFHIVCISWAS